MRGVIWFPRLLAVAVGLAVAARLWAFPEMARETKGACVACHSNPAGGAELTAGGKAFKTSKKAPEAAGKPARYVGSDRCRTCHIAQHKSWSETKHAGALATLHQADDEKSAEIAKKMKIAIKGSPASTDACVKCHVVGFQLGGGYPGADSARSAALSGVGCESCHGPGSLHLSASMADKKRFIQKSVGAALCTQCHTPVMTPGFKLEEMVVKGAHPVKTD